MKNISWRHIAPYIEAYYLDTVAAMTKRTFGKMIIFWHLLKCLSHQFGFDYKWYGWIKHISENNCL
jgi:hypothetical protein